MPYTPNYTFPNLTAPTGASDWPDYSGVDSTTNTPFEARQTPDLTSIGNSNGSSPMDTSQTGTYGIKVYTGPIHDFFHFHNCTNIFVLMWFDFNLRVLWFQGIKIKLAMQVRNQNFFILDLPRVIFICSCFLTWFKWYLLLINYESRFLIHVLKWPYSSKTTC